MYCSLRSIKMADTFLILNWHTLPPLKMIVVSFFFFFLLFSSCWHKAEKAQSLEPHSQILGHRSLSAVLKWPNRIRKRSASVSPGPRKRTRFTIHQSLTKDLRCTLWLYQLLFSHLLEELSGIPCKTCRCDQKSTLQEKIFPWMFSLSFYFFLFYC